MYKAEHLHTSWAPYLGDIDIDRQGILTDKKTKRQSTNTILKSSSAVPYSDKVQASENPDLHLLMYFLWHPL
jgi:hypothetical protein